MDGGLPCPSVLELTRTVRFAVGPGAGDPSSDAVNGFAGHPAMAGLGAHYELDITCRGDADLTTGYSRNITRIDAAARARAIPPIAHAFADREPDPARVLRQAWAALTTDLPTIARLRWRLSPTYSIELERPDMNAVLLRQSFEFAAAHRLHAPDLSAQENRAVFGACNNPAGHGHNYRVEPCVRAPLRERGAPAFTLRDLERITNDTLIKHLDHTHLNTDVPEFAELNPSVENIARVCYERLAPAIQAAGVELRSVTIWETEKTSCTYPAREVMPTAKDNT